MNKKYFLYAIVPVLTLVAVGSVYANSVAGQDNNPMNSLVNAIAEKFNLNVSDVQQVFDEHRQEMQAQRQEQMAEKQSEMQQKFEERLNQAVTDGKLTQEQANLIIAKKAELEAQRQNLQNGTPEENKEAMQEHRDELKQWAEDNNIPLQYFMFAGPGGLGHMGRGFGGQMPDETSE